MSAPRIVAAAVRKFGLTFSLPAPARHHDILHRMCGEFGIPQDAHTEEGFLTDGGTFVDRVMAAEVARDAGQVPLVKRTFPQSLLFSEDLW